MLHARSLLNEKPPLCAALLVHDHPLGNHMPSQMECSYCLFPSSCFMEDSTGLSVAEAQQLPCPTPFWCCFQPPNHKELLYTNHKQGEDCAAKTAPYATKGEGRRDCRNRATLVLCRWERTSITHSFHKNVNWRLLLSQDLISPSPSLLINR